MYDCKKCGNNNWKWKCEQGMLTGYCQGCGEKTNTFKAGRPTREEREKEEQEKKNNKVVISADLTASQSKSD